MIKFKVQSVSHGPIFYVVNMSNVSIFTSLDFEVTDSLHAFWDIKDYENDLFCCFCNMIGYFDSVVSKTRTAVMLDVEWNGNPNEVTQIV